MKTQYIAFLLLIGIGVSCRQTTKSSPSSIKEVMDGVVTRLYAELTPQQLDTISDPYILSYLTPEEKQVLATQYLTFEVDKPVRVSLMRHEAQKVLPFWLIASGFQKTDKLVKNEEYTYEVWQKDFPAGKIELGINGFDKHRPVYFITVGSSEKKGEPVTITNVNQENQHFEVSKVGAFTYHDWDELRITELPEELVGQTLFTTIRGRAREAHLVGAFRTTDTPSSETPDQVLLTVSSEPSTSMDVQWRTNQQTKNGQVKYWESGKKDTLTASAGKFEMQDRLLRNDRYINRFTAHLAGLKPKTGYGYKVGSPEGKWSAAYSFKTANNQAEPFSFVWFGDTHFSPFFGDMAQKVSERHPEVSFFQIAGDLVTTGLNRDDWDKLFNHVGNTFAYKPLYSVPGNHDSQDGLGAWMYREMFSYPKNGPEKIPAEMTYAYTWQNALYLMIDATLPLDDQTAWIEKQLASSKADWKFVMFHFPPYNFEEDYAEIRKKWCSLFDKYHVDMVMGGHTHYYMRTQPMYAEKPVDSPSKGTIYTISISIPAEHKEWPDEDYAVIRQQSGPLYQHIAIDGKKMTYKSFTADGKMIDELKISK